MMSLARTRSGRVGLAACLVVVTTLAWAGRGFAGDARIPLRAGMTGEDVRALQEMLEAAGFEVGGPDGVFGPETLRAVKEFQRAHDLHVDGIVGAETWSRLSAQAAEASAKTYTVRRGDTLSEIAERFGVSVRELVRVNSIADPSSIRVGQELRIPAGDGSTSRGGRLLAEVLPWERVARLFSGVARVTDVRTGLSFRVRRRGGHLHADVEPLTSEDAATMKKAYGGEWSWERRPIVVQIGARQIAASMNGMPHGGESVKGNGFPGHFCIHFAGSRLHANGKVDPEHQACVQEAAGLK